MLSIRTNLSSFIAQNSMRTSTDKLNQAIERMTTGSKINHAKDNAANYSISTNMTTKMGALQVAEDNALQGLEMMSSTSENLSLIEEKLVRMRALAVQAQSGTYGTKSLNALSAEADSLLNEINRINESATYNGIKLFNTGKDNSVTNAGKELELNAQGFLQDVVKVDTTGMTPLGSMPDDAMLAVGEYTISTAEELVQLASLNNAGLVEAGSTFTLTKDIDIGSWCRANEVNGGWVPIVNLQGVFNGNGYCIKGLYINRVSGDTQALFTRIQEVNNLKLEDVDITGRNQVGAIVANGANVTNCVVTGEIVGKGYVGGIVGGYNGGYARFCYANVQIKGEICVGGIFGYANYASVQSCFSEGSIEGKSDIGGILGAGDLISNSKSFMIVRGENNVGGISGRSSGGSSCYFKGSVSGNINVGGLVGIYQKSGPLEDSIMEGSVNGNTNTGVLLGSATAVNTKVSNCSYYAKNARIENLVGDATNVSLENIADTTIPTDYKLQIASSGDEATSTISCTTYIDFGGLKDLLSSGLESSSSIEKIDNLISIASLKQAELGMMEQRLYSVLDEISTQYENLVSSHSTIKDADMVKVSSQYIQQQILQDASATLLASTQNIQYQNVMGLLQSLQR